MILLVVGYGIFKKIDVFDNFLLGCSDSFKLVLKIFPNLLAMIFSVNILISSGFLDFFLNIISPLIKIPIEIISMALVRPISGNASLALLNNIYTKYGVDNFYSLMASVVQGSTDTTFYILALYYGSIGVKKLRYAPITSLFADFVGIISAITISYLLF
ncbi:MAG: spore maturation protein [Bacilli bacterium]|nr:spore maturation protein [Bacilli bacterium]